MLELEILRAFYLIGWFVLIAIAVIFLWAFAKVGRQKMKEKGVVPGLLLMLQVLGILAAGALLVIRFLGEINLF